MPSSYRIGVDGGGTKTDCILVDTTGTVVARHTAPGCNPSLAGADTAREIVLNALLALVSSVGCLSGAPRLSRAEMDAVPVTHTFLCMAGSPAFWQEFASTLLGYGQVETTTDAAPVLELATSDKPGLVLHAGTGSFVALRAPDGALHYAGGLGWRLGDPGSAHDIGRRTLIRGLAEFQGWAEPSAIGQLIREEFSTAEASAITTRLHRDPEPNLRIASLAARVSPLAAASNAVARAIILASVDELHACAVAAAERLFGNVALSTVSAGLSGSILTQPFVSSALAEKSPFALVPIAEPPIEGVRRLLIRQSKPKP